MIRNACVCVAGLTLCVFASVCVGQVPNLEAMDFVLKSVPDGPVARVNGVGIPPGEFKNLYRAELAALKMESGEKEIPDRLKLTTALRCLTILVQREILYQEALKRGLTVTQDELDKHWEEELRRITDHVVKKDSQPLTESDVLELAGMDRQTAMDEVRKEVLIDKIKDELAREEGVKVTDAEIAEAFKERSEFFKRPESYHLRQIFVRFADEKGNVDPAVKEAARAKIEAAMDRIRAGESFASVAQDLSDAPDSDNGGDMGMYPAAVLPPFYTEPAADMEPGDVSNIIESDLGFHIIKLVEFKPGSEGKLEEAEPAIRKMLRARKIKHVVDEFCKPVLKTRGAVQVYLALDKTLATHPNGDELRKQIVEGPVSLDGEE